MKDLRAGRIPAPSTFTRTNALGRACLLLALASAAAWALLAASSALASTVTVGSPLTGTYNSAPLNSVQTFTNSALPEAGANVTSPVTGTIVSWRITGATGGPFRLRVLTPGSGTTYTGAGTSTPQTPSSTATQTFTTNLPIQAGQTIGIDDTNTTDQLGFSSAFAGTGSIFWNPPLADNESRAGTANPGEGGFNADVQTATPSNTPSNVSSNVFTFGKLKRNKKKGTATQAVNVPGPGTLTLSGKGIVKQRPFRASSSRRLTKTVTAAGTVKLTIKAKGKAKKKLNKTGKVKVKAIFTFKPTGGAPSHQSKRIKLIKQR